MNDEEREELLEMENHKIYLNFLINTRLEHNKSLLFLSSSAISLLLGFVNQSTSNFANIEFLIYIFSLLCFLTSLIYTLIIFKQNERLFREEINLHKDSDFAIFSCFYHLYKSYNILNWCFGLGVISTVVLIIFRRVYS